MQEMPENYEEAKIIIKNSVGSEVEKAYLKKQKLKAIFVTALSFGATAAIGIITKLPLNVLVTLPIAAAFSLHQFLPILFQKKVDKRIENGDYFKKKTEEQVIDIAKKVVNEANEFERNKVK